MANADVRLSLSASFPSWLQHPLTIITGKALPQQEQPRWIPGPMVQFLIDWMVLVAAVGANAFLLSSWPIVGAAMYLVLAIVTVGRLRKFQVSHAHHLVHLHHKGHHRASSYLHTFLARVATAIPLAQNPEDYEEDHMKHHARRIFTTEKDPDAAFLLSLGFVPGTSKEKLWRNLARVIFSPSFHGRMLAVRIGSSLLGAAPCGQRVVALGWIAVLAFIGAHFGNGSWLAGFLAVVVPLGPLYNVSALLQFLSEHAWLVSATGPSDHATYVRRCWARFCGEAAPPPGLAGMARVSAWCKWAALMLCYHLPVRYGVLVGDLTCHDWHHVCPKDSSVLWVYAPYARQQHVESGHGHHPLVEHWGLFSAIDHVFEGLCNSPLSARVDGRSTPEAAR